MLYNIAEQCFMTYAEIWNISGEFHTQPQLDPEWRTIVSVPVVTTMIFHPTPSIDELGTHSSKHCLCDVGTQVLVRARLIHSLSILVFDIAHPIDPCLPHFWLSHVTELTSTTKNNTSLQ